MPTKREREYYALGFSDGFKAGKSKAEVESLGRSIGIGRSGRERELLSRVESARGQYRPTKRKLSARNKFVKANSKKPRFRYRNGKLNLKKMAVAFRKTPAGRKKRR